MEANLPTPTTARVELLIYQRVAIIIYPDESHGFPQSFPLVFRWFFSETGAPGRIDAAVLQMPPGQKEPASFPGKSPGKSRENHDFS